MSNVSIHCRAAERHERGSALVMAILVSGIVATLCVGVAQRFMVDAASVENRLQDLQGRQYLLAAEAMARQILAVDALDTVGDNLNEDWARVLPPFETEEGLLQVRLEDAQGRFNLNNLLGGGESLRELGLPPEQRFSLPQQDFIAMLQSLPSLALSEPDAIALTEALIDWLDRDDQPLGFGGAESLYYSNAGVPYRSANLPLASPGELRMIRHMTPAIYQQLLPLVTVLPESTPLNLNTALPALLGSLKPVREQKTTVQQLRQQQIERPFQAVGEVASQAALAELISGEGEQAQYDVDSHYFLLHAHLAHAGRELRMQSLIKRGPFGIDVLSRRFGSPLDIPVEMN